MALLGEQSTSNIAKRPVTNPLTMHSRRCLPDKVFCSRSHSYILHLLGSAMEYHRAGATITAPWARSAASRSSRGVGTASHHDQASHAGGALRQSEHSQERQRPDATCPIRWPGYARLVGYLCFRLECAEPLVEGRGTNASIRSGNERLVVQDGAIVARIAIRHHLA